MGLSVRPPLSDLPCPPTLHVFFELFSHEVSAIVPVLLSSLVALSLFCPVILVICGVDIKGCMVGLAWLPVVCEKLRFTV